MIYALLGQTRSTFTMEWLHRICWSIPTLDLLIHHFLPCWHLKDSCSFASHQINGMQIVDSMRPIRSSHRQQVSVTQIRTKLVKLIAQHSLHNRARVWADTEFSMVTTASGIAEPLSHCAGLFSASINCLAGTSRCWGSYNSCCECAPWCVNTISLSHAGSVVTDPCCVLIVTYLSL